MASNLFSFTPTHHHGGARRGRLVTPHGALETPNFIFCATKAAIKGLSTHAMHRAGADIILSNLYHLMLQPGAARIEAMGGLHAFTRWNGPMLTDSGGYQVFSMAFGGISDEIKGRNKALRPNTVLNIDDDGVTFRSYLDGAKIRMTPESSMQMQRQIGADLVMAFDECTAFTHTREYTENALARSHRWCVRSLEHFTKNNTDHKQAIYGIVQGAHYRDLREKAIRDIVEEPFFGTAIGGSFGQSKADLYAILDWCAPFHKPERPVHLLGVGDIPDIFKGIRRGMDTFDCVQPTRLGRHGWALMPDEPGGRINLRNARFRDDKTPLDPAGHHPHTAVYTRAYLHHLIKAEELLAIQILVEHNVAVMTRLMREIRAGIETGTLDAVEQKWLAHMPADTARAYGDARI
jgi:queuine tRNA-ribosyltransferase